MGTTAYHDLPYPEGTDLPMVHLDVRALAEDVDEELPIVAATAPPHRDGRVWIPAGTGAVLVSDGVRWRAPGHEGVAVQSGTGTAADATAVNVPGLAVTFTAVSGHRYAIPWRLTTYSSVIGDVVNVHLREGATAVGAASVPANSATGQSATGHDHAGEFLLTPTSGPHTLTLGISRAVGTGTITAPGPGHLRVVDLGLA